MTRDPLTDLLDRETFCRLFDNPLDVAGGRSGERVVLLLGIDDFRDVNSGLGYDVGNAVLVQVAARLGDLTASGWCVARSFGDIFAVFPPPHLTGAVPFQDVVDRVGAVLVDPFVLDDGIRLVLNASIGVAAGPDGTSAEVLMRNARIAMYRAKCEQVPWARYDGTLDADAATRLVRVAELREAIAAGQLEVHYQPVIELRTRKVVSLEALVRWRHPDRGLLSPVGFIGLAERCGLIDSLTQVVVSAVGEQSRMWAEAGRSVPCSVNVSVHSLTNPLFSDTLVATLSRLAGAVTVEVTESVFADDRAVAVLARLTEAGVRCSVDDFGTGYSSLGSLKDLPVDTVKIPRVFVKDLESDPRDFAMLEAIVEMATELRLGVIGEGVETEACAARLAEAGVHYAQGYLFARPMPAAELDSWFASDRCAGHHPTAAGGAPTPAGGGRRGGRTVSASDTQRVVLATSRALLRVDSVEQAVGVLMRAVTDLGGTVVPAIQAAATAIPIDVSLGHADPLLVTAPAGSDTRRILERTLPGLVEDAKVAADRAGRLTQLSDQVDTDPLTGLANRRGLSRVGLMLETHSIAMVDLDHFKLVNDTYGHADGDRVLVAFSRALRQHLRATDLVFRLGGEEFLLIMPGTPPEKVLTALEHLRRQWQTERPIPVTFSAGVTAVEKADLSAAVLAADGALYAAKQSGRDRFAVAESGSGSGSATVDMSPTHPTDPATAGTADPHQAGLPLADELLLHLASPDRRSAAQHCAALIDGGMTLEELVDRGLAPAMAQVGDLWQSAVWSVVDEHTATAVAEAALSAAAAQRLAPRTRGEVVIACVDGDWHSLPPRMVAEVVAGHGWSVRFLGASQPTGMLVDHLIRHPPDAVLLSCAVPMALPELLDAVQQIHELDLPVYVGGRALGRTPLRAQAVGADGWAASAAGAVELLAHPADTGPRRPARQVTGYRAQQVVLAAWTVDAMSALAELMPTIRGYSPEVWERTRLDLHHILDIACIAQLLQDPTLLDEQCEWLADVLAARSVPPDSLAHGLIALIHSEPNDGRTTSIGAALRQAHDHHVGRPAREQPGYRLAALPNHR